MSFPELLNQVGGMGRFQVLYVIFLNVPVLMLACHAVLQNFTGGSTDHHCQIHSNTSNISLVNMAQNLSSQDLLRISIPVDENQRLEKCRRFVTPQWWLLQPNATMSNTTVVETEPCIDGWVYDKSVFPSTIIMEWDLVCDFWKLKQMAQSIYMAGVLVGGIVFGGLSDRFGRRSLLIWCYLQMASMGTASAFSPSFSAYCVFRFLTGMAFSGIVLNCVSLCLEWTPTHMRAIVGTLNGYCYTLGQFFLAGMAYALPDWRWLQLTVSLPYFIFFLYSWWFTESARWLVITGKSNRAVKELKRVARINGKKEEGDKLNIEILKSNMQKEMSSVKNTHTIADLARTPVVRRISLCLCFVWFSTSFAYYGLAMDLQNFNVDIYVIQLIFGAVDIPAKLVSVLTITFIGRRFTQAAALILAGLSILANIFVPQDLQTLRTIMAVFGKGCLAASFNCVYIFTGELYPTVIRQTGMGLSNTMARIGSITAPMVKMLSEYFPSLPLIIYGAAPIISGIAATFLPETRNVPLPETVEEVETRAKQLREEEQQMKTLLAPAKPDPASEAGEKQL
ncbi:solute carrier family 22 member 6-A-like isoform X2 [Alligator sinensis]|uniref:Solute carrier family 22 member 6-A-like isoform X2 n=1 Tax=Alligator sinensis TaxID=38654 RepID=A0A3Q0FUF2_ALLSI|nr:solute carrier family 22 member 6-A-like isoform X2 [Alligator sinensis]